MGVNPHKSRAVPQKMRPFDISLFVDVYEAYEQELGREFLHCHAAMAAIMLDDKKQGRLECCGTLQNMQYLVSLLVMRLATVQASAVYEQSKGKKVLSIPESAKAILENVWKNIGALKKFDHEFPEKKEDIDIQKQG